MKKVANLYLKIDAKEITVNEDSSFDELTEYASSAFGCRVKHLKHTFVQDPLGSRDAVSELKKVARESDEICFVSQLPKPKKSTSSPPKMKLGVSHHHSDIVSTEKIIEERNMLRTKLELKEQRIKHMEESYAKREIETDIQRRRIYQILGEEIRKKEETIRDQSTEIQMRPLDAKEQDQYIDDVEKHNQMAVNDGRKFEVENEKLREKVKVLEDEAAALRNRVDVLEKELTDQVLNLTVNADKMSSTMEKMTSTMEKMIIDMEKLKLLPQKVAELEKQLNEKKSQDDKTDENGDC